MVSAEGAQLTSYIAAVDYISITDTRGVWIVVAQCRHRS